MFYKLITEQSLLQLIHCHWFFAYRNYYNEYSLNRCISNIKYIKYKTPFQQIINNYNISQSIIISPQYYHFIVHAGLANSTVSPIIKSSPSLSICPNLSVVEVIDKTIHAKIIKHPLAVFMFVHNSIFDEVSYKILKINYFCAYDIFLKAKMITIFRVPYILINIVR